MSILKPTLIAACVFLTPIAEAFDRFTAHGGPIKGIAHHAPSNLAVTTSFDYTAVVWFADSMEEIRPLVAHTAAVNAAAFSPDGRWLATGGDDTSIFLWDVETIQNLDVEPQPIELTGHTGKVVDLAFSNDGRQLVSSSWDHRIGLWDIETSSPIRFFQGHQGPVNAAVFSDDDDFVYSAGSDGHIRQWRVDTGGYLRSIVRNGFGVNVLALSTDLNVLAYGGANGVMKSVSLDASGPDIELWVGGPPVLAVDIDPATESMAFATAEGRIVIADALVGEIERDFQAVQGPVWAMQYTSQGSHLMFAGLDDWVTRIPLDDFVVPSALAARERRFHPDEPLGNGARQFARKCSVCHTLTPSSKRRAGPTLYGVFGRKVGAVEDYPYSPELLDMDLVWTEETIDRLFRDGPDIVTPGSKMPIQRIKRDSDRQDLIAYLKQATAPQ